MKFKLSLVALFASCLTIQAQMVPCVDGMAGEYPCNGYDLMSFISLDDLGITSNGNDSWGWTDPTNGDEYAIMGGDNRTTFVDITDPVNPIFVGYIETATNPSLWRDIKVFNDHAFIVSEAGGHGLQVFDLTRLRDAVDTPVDFDVDAYNDDFGHAHNIAINEETGFAYAIGANTFAGGPHFIDINDPLNPVSVGGYDGDGYTHDAQIVIYNGPDIEHHCKEIFFGYNANSLTIVDVTDKDDPIQLSRMEYANSGYTHQGWLTEDQRFVMMNDETDEGDFGHNTKTIVVNINDLDAPVITHEYFSDNEATDHNMYVNGDKVYQSNYRSGLRVLEISGDPLSPLSEVGFFDNYPESNAVGYSGTWSNYPYFESGNIVISSMDRGLFIVKSSDIIPNEVAINEVDCECESKAIFDQDVYTFCGEGPASMSISFVGDAPFVLDYSIDGVPQPPITTSLNPYNLVTFDADATYKLNGVSDANCYRQIISEATLETFTPVEFVTASLQEICSSDSSTYIVSFEIEEGNPDTYSVVGSYFFDGSFIPVDGNLTGTTYMSDPIPSGAPYSFEIADVCTTAEIQDTVVCSTGVGVEELNMIQFEIYPNPTESVLIVEVDHQVDISSISITDIAGRKLMSNAKVSRIDGNMQIDVSGLSTGTYFLIVNDNSVKRFVVK